MSHVPDSKAPAGGRRASPAVPAVPDLPRAAPPQPASIGKYRVLERIGAGAMGVVYKCEQPDLDRLVAVKVLLAARHAEPRQLQRFQTEARAAARLAHPNVVQVYDVGSDDGLPFLVMEYVAGPSLDRLIGSPRLKLEAALRVTYHIAHALHAAHAQGIIHRDVKPSNILIDPAGRPKLADFGLARGAAGAGVSATGDLVGTPRYMAPEQALGTSDDVDIRADVYALGAVMYEMLTSAPMVEGATALAALRFLTEEEPVPVRQRNPAVPAEVAEICARAAARDRDARYPSALALAEAIQRYLLAHWFARPEVETLAGLAPPSPRPPRRRLAFGLAVAALTALLGFAAARWWFPHPAAENRAARPAQVDVAGVLARTRDQLRELPAVADARSHRARLSALLDDLNAAARQAPADRDLRLARARVLRRSGAFLAAVEDVNAVGAEAKTPALSERLLARYQLEVLYLGNPAEPLVRAPASRELQADAEALGRRPDPAARHFARLAAALARGDLAAAAGLAEKRPADVLAEGRADLAMLEADALFRAAEAAHAQEKQADDDARPAARRRREGLAARAVQALRQGLEADPHHVGLLFLKANSWHRRALWEAGDDDSREQLLRRNRPAFETALNRFSTACAGAGPEAPAARAVLLFNFGRNDPALDQVKQALALRPDLAPLYALRAWLQLTTPAPEGELTPAEVERIARDLEPAFETPPEAFNLYFVRALVHAAAGRWDEARRDLLQCRQRLGKEPLPDTAESHLHWFQAADGPFVKFLGATGEVLDALAAPVDLRLRLAEDTVKRLAGDDAAGREGVTEDEARQLRGWGHYRLAHGWAEKDDRGRALKHARAALEQRLKDLTPQTFHDDDVFKPWEKDEDFVKLYAEFAEKP